MPRESTRQPARQEAAGSHMEMEIKQSERAVWVALSGILDRRGVDRLVACITPHLNRSTCRVVLDGSGLIHLDYRATRDLVAWNRKLRGYGHELFLHRWSEYLKAILVMEDWDRELGAEPRVLATRHRPAATAERGS